MTPDDFIRKWQPVELSERSASQSHFNDLCRLLGLPDPVAADPKKEWFTFEKGVEKAGGGQGWADVWRKDCFGWEYKGKGKDLKAALRQLLGYSPNLLTPPLLIVSDTNRIEIHTNFQGYVNETHVITLEDLRDAGKRELLRACFTNPERLKPAQTRQDLTEEAAKKFAAIAERLRQRKHNPHAVAHFVNRLVFCMFAEDVNLLPRQLKLCSDRLTNSLRHRRFPEQNPIAAGGTLTAAGSGPVLPQQSLLSFSRPESAQQSGCSVRLVGEDGAQDRASHQSLRLP
jgi:hypothetical protein